MIFIEKLIHYENTLDVFYVIFFDFFFDFNFNLDFEFEYKKLLKLMVSHF